MYRLAMPGITKPVLGGNPNSCRACLIEEQQFIEYEVGIPCWIERQVIHQFNTFSTECWV